MEESKKNYSEENDVEKAENITPDTEELTENDSAEKDLAEEENKSDNKPKKKGRVKKVVLVILAVLLVIIIALCIRFRNILSLVTWDNIVSAWNAWWYSTDDIEKQMQDNKAKMEKIAEEDPLIDIRGELTDEEALALKNGEITAEEAKRIVKGEITLEEIRKSKNKAEEAPEPTEPADEPPPPEEPVQEPAQSTGNDKVSEIVAELYVIQAEFITKLEAIGDQAYADYKATHYDRSKVMDIVDSYVATVGQLESECDEKVNSLIKELKAELTKVGRDHSLAKEIQNYYYTEKSLKKSYYLNKLDDEDYK